MRHTLHLIQWTALITMFAFYAIRLEILRRATPKGLNPPSEDVEYELGLLYGLFNLQISGPPKELEKVALVFKIAFIVAMMLVLKLLGL